ncbi:Rhamnogalacturonate lyase [Actinidia chinensis var. chinensis]|uniref:rhamnogalacturonan endolyase n=1 Tax=Actinidia chinensis var. chinensis TaxID=1590841 RepID=A0A2R6RJ44_ACTCC|nr:Rhamnogalacturonate lyase [Actinidia chinensis var. chinensis]
MKRAGWFGVAVQLFLLVESSVKTPVRRFPGSIDSPDPILSPPVHLRILDQHVIMDNGLVNVTLSTPQGMVTGIQYNGIDNLLQLNRETNRGYWDVVWGSLDPPGNLGGKYDLLEGTSFSVVLEDENQIELSFTRTWNSSQNGTGIPLNIDKRFIMLRGCPGFYSYGIFEHEEGGPDINIYQGRIVFKLEETLFQYMAVSDERQRIMPTAGDRQNGLVLDYPEAVLLTNPSNPELRGEVDDKYQYSCDDNNNRVHGWICSNPPVGFWMITPSDEFRTGGPVKQDLTSHVGPTTLSMFFSTHYAGESLAIELRDGEPWKKVFGPVLIYLNTNSPDEDALPLWEDAKEQMLIETQSWPYDFPLSEDFPRTDQRGIVTGRLLVRDRYINKELLTANFAFVGLAAPGDVGSWQRENKGYQFWTQADNEGYFLIKGVRNGNYSLYAWVAGIIGDYKYDAYVNITPGSRIRLGVLVYEPPREGPTLWEIGSPDRSAAEFYVPDPNPTLLNQLYVNLPDKFRQYGLWDRYADVYPDEDLTYTVGISNYQTDWFFAHVNRNLGNKTYEPTTWRIIFVLDNLIDTGTYTFQLAIASAHEAELEVRINEADEMPPHFTTGFIGKDNAIARHGIHGLYWWFKVEISASQLVTGSNTIYLTQSRGSSPFKGIMYDYIRLEGPPETD